MHGISEINSGHLKDGSSKDPLVSVVIPFRDPGPAINRCLSSLTSQTLKDTELIFVDDCSTDDTAEVIRKAARSDGRIRILTNPVNIGPGPSRNRGIDEAKGKYIAFIDADDHISPDFFELLMARAFSEDLPDIVIGSFLSGNPETGYTDSRLDERQSRLINQASDNDFPLWYMFRYGHWCAIYKREMLLRSGARYGTSPRSEDTTFLLKTGFFAENFATEQNARYYYTIRDWETSSPEKITSQIEGAYLAAKEQFSFISRYLDKHPMSSFYVLERTEFLLGMLPLYRRLCPDPAGSDRLLEALRSEVLRLPFCRMMMERYLSIYALIRDGKNLTPYPFSEFQKSKDRASAYREMLLARDIYLRDHPELTEIHRNSQTIMRRSALLFYAQESSSGEAYPELNELYRTASRSSSPLVSVIIPVGDPGPGIDRCLTSLRSQALKNIELIFVDDRGNDGAIERIRLAAKEDDRIRIITNSSNIGPGRSRNKGIEAASGEYLAFVDADDHIAEEYLELLFAKAKETGADIVKGTHSRLEEGQPASEALHDTCQNPMIREGLKQGRPLWSLFWRWHYTALYRREFIIEKGLRYGSTCYSEDCTFLLRVCSEAQSFATEDRALYFYVVRNGSLVRTVSEKRAHEETEALREQFEYLCSHDMTDLTAREYVYSKLCWNMSIQHHMAGCPGLSEAAADYLQSVVHEARRLPFIHELAGEHFDIRILLEYEINLCCKNWILPGIKAEAYDRIRLFNTMAEFTLSHREYFPLLQEPMQRHYKRAYELIKQMDIEDTISPQIYENFKRLRELTQRLKDTPGDLSGGRRPPAVSVVVPVCDPGDEMARCIDSLRAQTLKNIELIFVDDHGSDNAMDLVRAASAEDDRIRVITNKENLGAGPSRNAGIEASSGEYLAFVDADDHIAPDHLELLYSKAVQDQADVVKGSIAALEEDGELPGAKMLEWEQRSIKEGIRNGRPLWLCCFRHQSAVYRREFLIMEGIRYGRSRNAQDTTFLLRALYAAKSFSFEEKAVYYYTKRTGSAVAVFSEKRLQNELEGLRDKIAFLTEHPVDPADAAEYMHSQIVWNLQIQNHAASIPELAEASERYLTQLAYEVRSLPFSEDLKNRYTEMRALTEDGVNLCSTPWPRPVSPETHARERLRILKNISGYASMHPNMSEDLQGSDASAETENLQKAPAVSVIIPVYDPGPGISRCIGSLRSQLLNDIELIFVDDRGTDSSMEEVRAAAAADPRIRIITNQENLGAGPARNAGIEEASGEYFAFVDADDYVAPDFLALLYTKAKAADADIVKGSIVYVDQEEKHETLTELNTRIRAGLAKGKPLWQLFLYEHQSAIYRRSLSIDSGARYGTSRVSQDDTFLLRACLVAKSFETETNAYYYYKKRSGANTQIFTAKRLQNQILALHEQFDILSGALSDEDAASDHAYGRIHFLLRMMHYYFSLPDAEPVRYELLDKLTDEIKRLPFYDELLRKHLVIRALSDQGIILCEEPFSPFWYRRAAFDEYREILTEWMDLVDAHPDLGEQYSGEIATVFNKALMYCAKAMAVQGQESEAASLYCFLNDCRRRLKEMLPVMK